MTHSELIPPYDAPSFFATLNTLADDTQRHRIAFPLSDNLGQMVLMFGRISEVDGSVNQVGFNYAQMARSSSALVSTLDLGSGQMPHVYSIDPAYPSPGVIEIPLVKDQTPRLLLPEDIARLGQKVLGADFTQTTPIIEVQRRVAEEQRYGVQWTAQVLMDPQPLPFDQ